MKQKSAELEVVLNHQMTERVFRDFSRVSYPGYNEREIIIARDVVEVFNSTIKSQDHIVGAYVFTYERVISNSFFQNKEVFVYLMFQTVASEYLVDRTAIAEKILSLVKEVEEQYKTAIAIVISYVEYPDYVIFENEIKLPSSFHDDTSFYSLFS